MPGRDNDIRAGFDLRCEQLGIRCRIRAEFDDMALLLSARDSESVALLPHVVVQDELSTGRLVEYAVVPDLYDDFYGVTVQRHCEPPLVQALLARSESEILQPQRDCDQAPAADPAVRGLIVHTEAERGRLQVHRRPFSRVPTAARAQWRFVNEIVRI